MGRLYWQNGMKTQHYGIVTMPNARRHYTFEAAVRARRKDKVTTCVCPCGCEEEIPSIPRRLFFWKPHPMVLHWVCPDCGAWAISKVEEDIG